MKSVARYASDLIQNYHSNMTGIWGNTFLLAEFKCIIKHVGLFVHKCLGRNGRLLVRLFLTEIFRLICMNMADWFIFRSGGQN